MVLSVQQLHRLLEYATSNSISDVHLKANQTPHFRKDSLLLTHPDFGTIPEGFLDDVLQSISTAEDHEQLRKSRNLDLAYSAQGIGRFRLNVFFQLNQMGMVFRHIPDRVPELSTLQLPAVVSDMVQQSRGLILVTGATGSGKSTTVAGMIQHINEHRASHIVTLEDPVEFLHQDRKSVVNQRQVGSDVTSFQNGLRSALRQDPDVIVIGEMRDMETMYTALRAAETGHLVLSTLHTLDAKETLLRVIHMCPPREQHGLRYLLASTLYGVVSQRLVRSVEGGRLPAVEVLINTPRVKRLITEEEGHLELKQAIEEGRSPYGMQTFDDSLLELYKSGQIELGEALGNATSPEDFRLRVSGIRSGTTV